MVSDWGETTGGKSQCQRKAADYIPDRPGRSRSPRPPPPMRLLSVVTGHRQAGLAVDQLGHGVDLGVGKGGDPAFGRRAGDPAYDAIYDLSGNGVVDFPDFVQFAVLFAAG